MTFATSICTKSFKHARNARVANCLSSMASSKKKLALVPLRAQERELTVSRKPLKGRMTIEEVKAALEPITRAREQGLLVLKPIWQDVDY